MDVVTLALAKGGAKSYTDQAISSLGAGFTYKGSVATVADLPSPATAGDEYTVGNLGAYVYDGSEWKPVSQKIGTGNLILKNEGQTLATFNANSSENVEVVLPSGKEYVKAIKIINQSITLGEVNTLLNTINTAEEHVFFDVSALGAKMYLCTISIDTTAATYTIFDLVLGRTASGVYESSKLLTMAIAQATTIATQKQIDHLQEEIDELGGSERIKNLEQLGNLIESGDSPNLISAGDSITFNWVKTVLGTTTHGLTVTCSDEDLFINGVGECEEKDYLLVYDGTSWTYNEEVIDLTEWGLSVSGTPQSGEVMTVNVTVDPIEYVFTGYDDMTAHDSAVPHNWLMEQKYAPSTMTYDTYEALFTIMAGKTLPAGSYHIRRYSYYYGFNADMYFTIASALGDANNKVQLCGTEYNSGQTVVNADGQTKTNTYTIKGLSPKIYKTQASAGANVALAYAPTEGVEYTELSTLAEGDDPVVKMWSHDKTMFGSNIFEYSNIYQRLNDDTKGDNYEPTTDFDVPVSANRGKGFLWGLDPRVKALMLDCDIDLIAGYDHPEHERNTYYTHTCKVFLLSMKEMSFNINTSEGDVSDLYNEYTGGVLTNNACEGRAKYNKAGGTLNNYRWSRSASSSYANDAYNLTSTGSYNGGSACGARYFAPAFIIGKASANQ